MIDAVIVEVLEEGLDEYTSSTQDVFVPHINCSVHDAECFSSQW